MDQSQFVVCTYKIGVMVPLYLYFIKITIKLIFSINRRIYFFFYIKNMCFKMISYNLALKKNVNDIDLEEIKLTPQII